jgi:hypothetical protein
MPANVRGEPVFSVMAARWFCEKSGWIGKVKDVKPVLLANLKINLKKGFQPAPILRGGFLPGWIVKHANIIRLDLSRAGHHMILGFKLSIHCRHVVVWWMSNIRNFCFIIAFHIFVILENRLTYQYPSSWPVVITMKKKLVSSWKIYIGYRPVQINGNKFATGQILGKPVEVVRGRILAGLSSKVSRTLAGKRAAIFWVQHFKLMKFRNNKCQCRKILVSDITTKGTRRVGEQGTKVLCCK